MWYFLMCPNVPAVIISKHYPAQSSGHRSRYFSRKEVPVARWVWCSFAIQVQRVLSIFVSRYKVTKRLIISPGIVILLTAGARRVLTPVILNLVRVGGICKNYKELINYSTIPVSEAFFFSPSTGSYFKGLFFYNPSSQDDISDF
jgi:hypothetical protein